MGILEHLGVRVGKRRVLGIPVPWAMGAAAAGVLVIAVALTIPRGGDGPTPSGSAPTPEPGGEPAGLLETAALPGDGWSAEARQGLADIYGASDVYQSSIPDIDACRPLRDFETALYRSDDAFRDGEMQDHERQTATGGVTHVRHIVTSFDGPTSMDDAWRLLGEVLDSGAHGSCLVAAQAAADVNVSHEVVSAPAAPHEGRSSAMTYRTSYGAVTTEIHQVLAWWRRDVVLHALTITTTGQPLPTDEVAAVLAAAGGGT